MHSLFLRQRYRDLLAQIRQVRFTKPAPEMPEGDEERLRGLMSRWIEKGGQVDRGPGAVLNIEGG